MAALGVCDSAAAGISVELAGSSDAGWWAIVETSRNASTLSCSRTASCSRTLEWVDACRTWNVV